MFDNAMQKMVLEIWFKTQCKNSTDYGDVQYAQ